MEPRPDGMMVESHLVRPRDVLVLVGDASPLAQELDLHILSCGLSYDPLLRQLLRDGLTALSLHLMSRPVDEHAGWTVSIQQPPLNLFFVGSASNPVTVAGRAFEEGVEPRSSNLFISQTRDRTGAQHVSSVEFDGVDLYATVEQYYRQSEQKPARFLHAGSRTALVLGLPDADREWLEALDAERVFTLSGENDVQLLARREVKFRCGCDRRKIAQVLVGLYGEDPEELFEKRPQVTVECPRCAAEYAITRGEFETERAQGASGTG